MSVVIYYIYGIAGCRQRTLQGDRSAVGEFKLRKRICVNYEEERAKNGALGNTRPDRKGGGGMAVEDNSLAAVREVTSKPLVKGAGDANRGK